MNQNEDKTVPYDELEKILREQVNKADGDDESKIVGESLEIFEREFLKNRTQKKVTADALVKKYPPFFRNTSKTDHIISLTPARSSWI